MYRIRDIFSQLNNYLTKKPSNIPLYQRDEFLEKSSSEEELSFDFIQPHEEPCIDYIISNPRMGVYVMWRYSAPIEGVSLEILDEETQRFEPEKDTYYIARKESALFRWASTHEIFLCERNKQSELLYCTEDKPMDAPQKPSFNEFLRKIYHHRWFEISDCAVRAFWIVEASMLTKGISLGLMSVGISSLPSWFQQLLHDQHNERPDGFLMEQHAISSMLLISQLCDELPKIIPEEKSDMLHLVQSIQKNINAYEKFLAQRVSSLPLELSVDKHAPTPVLKEKPPPPKIIHPSRASTSTPSLKKSIAATTTTTLSFN